MAVDEAPEAPRNAGIVGDVIAQFADPNAFDRELVQNSHHAAEQVMHVTVRDRGGGMTRDF